MTSSPQQQRLNVGDVVRVTPQGGDAYDAKIADLGAWGMTIKLGPRLAFVPWSSVRLVVRLVAA